MKTLRYIPVLLLFVLASCNPVRVVVDYDKNTNFDQYSSYAFFKPGIDQVEISDLDKKRILRAIDNELSSKGLQKSENPTLLVSFFTKSNERINVYQSHYGWGYWGWGHPWHGTSVSQTTEGTLYIDLIDAKTNELVWQGIGSASLFKGNPDKKEARINLIVQEILSQY